MVEPQGNPGRQLLVERGVDSVHRSDHKERIAGAAFTAASVPILPAAPGRFSMTNGCPSCSNSHWNLGAERRDGGALPSRYEATPKG